jgi:hypothetical protein
MSLASAWVSARRFCWNSLTQLVTVFTISRAACWAVSPADLTLPALAFGFLRSSRFTILMTFFSDMMILLLFLPTLAYSGPLVFTCLTTRL